MPAVLLRGMDEESDPHAADVEQIFPASQRQLAADMVELCLLRSVEIHFRSLEIGTRVHHGPIQPDRIELVRDVVMKMNGIAILRLRMRLDSRCIRGSK